MIHQKEKEVLGDVLVHIFNKNNEHTIISPLLTEVMYYAFVWHWEQKKKWVSIEIEKNGISNEINEIDEILANKSTDEKLNFYWNVFNQYIHYRLTQTFDFQFYFLKKFAREVSIDLIKEQVKKTIKPYLRFGYKGISKVVEDEANNIHGKKELPQLKKRMKRFLSGYPQEGDEKLICFFDSLIKYKSYLEQKLTGKHLSTNGQIICYQTKDEIGKYFLKLDRINKDEGEFADQQILAKEDINHLIEANFSCFNSQKPIKKIHVSCSNASLMYFVWGFYKIEKSKNSDAKASDYHRFLKDNFSNLDSWEIENIKKAFSRKCPKKYPLK